MMVMLLAKLDRDNSNTLSQGITIIKPLRITLLTTG